MLARAAASAAMDCSDAFTDPAENDLAESMSPTAFNPTGGRRAVLGRYAFQEAGRLPFEPDAAEDRRDLPEVNDGFRQRAQSFYGGRSAAI
jgi:hypothetical protein